MNLKNYLKAFLTVCIVSMTALQSSAQTNAVSGTVFEPDGKTPAIGVLVSVPGTGIGVITDAGGRYRINAPSPESVLNFSIMGYDTQETVVGNRSVINITLSEESTQIDEVVITALGISREEKSLGYAVSKIDGDALTNTVSSNWLNALSGKVAGLNFDGASSGPGGSMRVTLRGEGSLSHDNNEALFVIDGIPVTNPKISSGGSSYSDIDAPVDFGNNISDLNPDDIESISVLKGPAATALYGSRAGNGALIITTKSGRTTKGLGISFSSSVVIEKAGFWPDLQYEYGAGNGGMSADNGLQQHYYGFWSITTPGMTTDGGTNRGRFQSRYAYGPKYEGQLFYQHNGYDWATDKWTATPWVAKDWYEGFFQTGVTYSNSVSIDGNMGKESSFRLSMKDMRNTWIVPNTGYNSQNVNLSVSTRLNKAIKLSAKANYIRKASHNLPTTGYSQSSPLYAIMWNVVSEDSDAYYREWAEGRIPKQHKAMAAQNSETPGRLLINNASGSARSENAYWLAYESLNSLDRDRVYGNAQIDARITSKINLLIRSGVDLTDDFRTSQKPQFSYERANGWYREQTSTAYEMNNDFLLSYNDTFDLAGDFTVSASFGGNNMVYNYRYTRITADELLEPNVFKISNSLNRPTTSTYRSNKSVNSLYGIASIGWRDMLYLDITGRNDWSSTLAKGYWSFFYPSVSASVLLNEVFKLRTKAPWINMLKLRGSWANVGNDTSPYSILPMYDNGSFASSQELPDTKPNLVIKPENVESWEVGVEAKLLNNRISFDVAYYHANTTNQIIPVPVDWMAGASNLLINAGKVTNKGVEIALSAYPIKTANWSWNISANWSKNWNKLVELAPGVDLWQMNSNTVGSRVFIYAKPGTELGRIYGFGYERAPEGAYYIDSNGKKVDCSREVIVDAATGNPRLTTNELQDFGSIYPDWKGGLSTTLTYKNLSFNATFTGQVGGKCYSVTNFALAYQGKTKSTLPGRYEGLIHDGVNRNADGTYGKNTTITTDVVKYYNEYVWARDNVETNTFDTSFLKFKEARIDYSLPKKWMVKSKVFQGISVGFFATNIFCITNFPQYDPDAASMNNGSISRGIESGSYPMTRTYGFNLKLNF